MLDEVWPFVDDQYRAGRRVVLARLVGRDGPGSRPLGATMAIAADGTWRGSLSGGCVEGLVVETARAVLDGDAPHLTTVLPGEQLLPWEDAPACAGELQVLVAPAPSEQVHTAITAALQQNRQLAVRVELEPPHRWSVGSTAEHVAGGRAAFVEDLPRRRRLVLIGATDLAAAIATLAGPLRREVIVIDPRPGHVASGAFPDTARVVRAWPDEWFTDNSPEPTDSVITLSHDPRIDDLAVTAALAAGVRHVAVLGSRATHAQRLRRLAGTPGLDRVTGPAGLDLGGSSLAETAVSILAEVIAVENGRAGGHLRDGAASIRAEPEPEPAPVHTYS